MTTPRYYRGPPSCLWLPLLMLGTLAASVFAARHLLATHDARVRSSVYDAASAHATATLTLQRAHWQRQRDSLTAITRQRDTVLVASIQRVRELFRDTVPVEVSSNPLPLPALDSARRNACTALADDCQAFRISATASLLAADSLHALDDARVTQLALQRVAVSDSVRTITAQRDRRPTRARALVGALSLGGLAYVVGRLTP